MTDETNVRQWQMPLVGEPVATPMSRQKNNQSALNAERAEAKEVGLQQGLQAAQDQMQQQFVQLNNIVQMLDSPLQQVEDQLFNEILALVKSLVRSIVQQSIIKDDTLLLDIIKNVINLLPSATGMQELHVNAEDKIILQKSIADGSIRLNNISIVESAQYARGECKLLGEGGEIDASLDAKITELTEAIFNDDVSS